MTDDIRFERLGPKVRATRVPRDGGGPTAIGPYVLTEADAVTALRAVEQPPALAPWRASAMWLDALNSADRALVRGLIDAHEHAYDAMLAYVAGRLAISPDELDAHCRRLRDREAHRDRVRLLAPIGAAAVAVMAVAAGLALT